VVLWEHTYCPPSEAQCPLGSAMWATAPRRLKKKSKSLTGTAGTGALLVPRHDAPAHVSGRQELEIAGHEPVLRPGPGLLVVFLATPESLGDAGRQAPRDEKGDRGPGTPVGCDHAPHMG
jgi:hypothetical protein